MESKTADTVHEEKGKGLFGLLLAVSIIVEVIGASFMPLAAEDWWYFAAVLGFWYASLFLYIYLTNKSEVGIVSAIWTGGGTALITVSGIVLFGEAISFVKIAGLVLIIAGVCYMNVLPAKEEVY